MIIETSSFSKSSVFKMFSSMVKLKAGVFKFLRFEERFRKAPFSRRISVDGRPSRRNKAAFANFSGVVHLDGAYSYRLISRQKIALPKER